jgi:hypothetical protein
VTLREQNVYPEELQAAAAADFYFNASTCRM